MIRKIISQPAPLECRLRDVPGDGTGGAMTGAAIVLLRLRFGFGVGLGLGGFDIGDGIAQM